MKIYYLSSIPKFTSSTQTISVSAPLNVPGSFVHQLALLSIVRAVVAYTTSTVQLDHEGGYRQVGSRMCFPTKFGHYSSGAVSERVSACWSPLKTGWFGGSWEELTARHLHSGWQLLLNC